MRKFQVVVNGQPYVVEVEELGASAPIQYAAPAPAPVAAAPVPEAAPAPAAKPQVSAAPAGAETIKAPMPGSILKVQVNTGDAVKKGQVLCILEAMKMENEIISPRDGVVAAVMVQKGVSVNAGDGLVALN